jgi:hypothetical protein
MSALCGGEDTGYRRKLLGLGAAMVRRKSIQKYMSESIRGG